jgi:hypothetical protein
VALFRRRKADAEVQVAPEHSVITHLPLSDDAFGTRAEREAIHELEGCIEEAVAAIGGEHDGDEFGGGEAVLFTCGPDADILFAAVARCLEGFQFVPAPMRSSAMDERTTRGHARSASGSPQAG